MDKARRPRAARACDACRVKKNKCDDLSPCTYCKNRGINCLYKGKSSSHSHYGSEYVRELEERVASLSKLLENPQPSQPQATEPDLPDHNGGVFRQPQVDALNETSYTPGQTSGQRLGSLNAAEASSTTAGLSDQEVSGVNQHTRNTEFYGSSSSMTLLSHVNNSNGNFESEALLSSLHNPAFTPPEATRKENLPSSSHIPGRASHYPQCRGFLENYFTAVHYIHPILDKAEFFERCEMLWSQSADQVPSFTALYYSVLSFAALISPRDDEPLQGLNNIQWSRLLFKEATTRSNQLTMMTDLNMVQCCFFLAKVCQNEIMPHWSYMYVGLAVRTALAIGINRASRPNTHKSPVQIKAESRTWWGLYSLETEMSFAMGRPDTLGADTYHNQRYPVIRDVDSGDPDLLEPPHCAIIRIMVDFSQVTKQVCLGVYLTEFDLHGTLSRALQIEQELDRWIADLPPDIRPRLQTNATLSLQDARAPRWVKRQRLVLTIRYHNLRILTFGTLLLRSTKKERLAFPESYQGVQKCLESARRTIEIIYEALQHNDFFRTWFYNTTYTVFAASIILVYISREAPQGEIVYLQRLVDMSIDILELMNESVVAQAAAKMLKKAKDATEHGPEVSTTVIEDSRLLNHYWGRLDLVDGDMDFDTVFALDGFDNNDFLMPFDAQ